MLSKLFKSQVREEESGNGNGFHVNGNGPFIQLNQVVKTFKNAAGEFTVLKGIDLDFYRGEFVGVIGKSGSGKSTLINMITGIDRPTSGEVFVGGVAVHKLTENQMAIWRGRNLGIVFQFFQLLPTLSLLENVMLPMDFCNMYTPSERKERAMMLLEMVEMQDHANKLPTAISGGQQQRVAIARALANDPPILIADEPTGNLDSKTADAVFVMFENLARQGKTIVMVTHDSALAKRVTRTVLIADGEIVNEWVAKALPTLTHQQMLKVTHQIEPLSFDPGQTIIQEGEAGTQFYIITKGVVEVVLKRPGGNDVVVAQMGPGQYVGEVETFRSIKAIASVRAGHAPVEAIALEPEEFQQLITESQTTREVMQDIVEQREQENIDHRKEKE
ncbi:MAG: ATP-binding cassette domain-containing protein [Anaerolineae bacterium]|nr:ATP-binding cassette domain-containing protein [Anaerolineae bacterium]